MSAQSSQRCDCCTHYRWTAVERGYCERLRKGLQRLNVKTNVPVFSVHRYRVRADDYCGSFKKAEPLSADKVDS